ncbi:helix-turn-helix domain-containing protein [Variovorax sp. J22P168]|uniref:TetR/AcrR family transcriptional regulator n=1 Tax=Variovorax jilinensis TaxID=3053513 RepID=UPI002577AEE7|nr:TetR/AcrR family transcriptional regulator [Variovorax sp. J22P168]MDM0015578.1 helix-turn-helix domain-containing protein [Variovorax sp. J22P168]
MTPVTPIPATPARRRIQAAAMKLFAEQGVTRVSVSELAMAAGMARGTIYSNVPDIDSLFEEVAAELVRDMVERVMLGFVGVEDRAHQLAIGVRLYIRRAHEEPLWGRFMSRFALSSASLQAVLTSDPAVNLRAGMESGRYRIRPEQLPAMVGMLTGSTLAAMLPVIEGLGTWREVGSDTAELLLIVLGLDRDEARSLARVELPILPAASS